WFIGQGPPSPDASGPGPLGNVAVTLLGLAYVPLLASFVGLTLGRPDGRGVVVVSIGAVAVYDTFAYLGGSRFGRRRLAPSISPAKTLEGTLIATLSTLVLVTLVAPRLGPWSTGQAGVLAALICTAAPLGDLFESLLKRDLGMKDTGSALPGHGGVLDRIDAMLFCAPVAYLTLHIFDL
ncbi:MAG: phosphatidate cytidylyltransferase, partial [Actinomycetota bacterium]